MDHSVIADSRIGKAEARQILHVAEVRQPIVRNRRFAQTEDAKVLQFSKRCQADVGNLGILNIESLQRLQDEKGIDAFVSEFRPGDGERFKVSKCLQMLQILLIELHRVDFESSEFCQFGQMCQCRTRELIVVVEEQHFQTDQGRQVPDSLVCDFVTSKKTDAFELVELANGFQTNVRDIGYLNR